MLNVVVCPVSGVVKMDLIKSDEFAHDLRTMYLENPYWATTDRDSAIRFLIAVDADHIAIRTCEIVDFLTKSAEFDDRHYDRCDIEGDRLDRIAPYENLLNTTSIVNGYNHWITQLVSSVQNMLWAYVSGREDQWLLTSVVYEWLDSPDSRSDREWMLERLKETIRFKIQNDIFP